MDIAMFLRRLTRRRFLQSTSVSAAALALPRLVPARAPGEIILRRRSSPAAAPTAETRPLDPARVGIVIIDMWNYHWCITCTHRLVSMIPRVNAALAGARKLGMRVFWAPTDEILPFFGTPQRERAAAVRYHDFPAKTRKLEVDFTIGGCACMCGPGLDCILNYGCDSQNAALVVHDDDDVISNATELYSLCREGGLTTLIYMGIATNICVMGKPPAMKALYEAGMDCIIARDATDAFTGYHPGRSHPDKGTAQCVEDIERAGIPSINMAGEMARQGVLDPDLLTEPVRFEPWGKLDRPYLFEDSATVTFSTPWLSGVTYYYTLDGTEPNTRSPKYLEPLVLTQTTTLKAAAFRHDKRVSLVSDGFFVRLGPMPPKPDVPLADCTRIMVAPPRYGWLPKVNQSWEGYPLTMRLKEYTQGLGCRAPTELLYDIRPEFRSFVALAGIDDGFVQRGVDPSPGVKGRRVACYPSVVFKVFMAGKLAAQSPVMRVSVEPWRFNVPIPRGASRISLVLNSTGSRHPLDCGNWVDAGFALAQNQP